MQSKALRQVQGSELVQTVATLDALAGLLDTRRNCLKLKTLFSTRGSGWNNPPAFHSSCDNKGPTFVLIRSSDGNSYGGYTSISWTASGSYQQDAQAYLFRLISAGGPESQVRPEKFRVSVESKAQYSDTSNGPCFGAGKILHTFSNSGMALSTVVNSYPTVQPLITSSVPKAPDNFQLEVLQVIIEEAAELEEPWLAGVSWAAEVQ